MKVGFKGVYISRTRFPDVSYFDHYTLNTHINMMEALFISAHAGDDKAAASKKVDPDLDVETESVNLPLYGIYISHISLSIV